jgi:hypothetical protein
MPEENSSAPRRAAQWLLQRALRFWPHESGKWGRAVAAELPSVENSWDAFRWAIGGLVILIREWLRHALGSWKRPIGVPAGGPLESEWKNSPRVPRTPRWITALLLLASACFFLTSDMRQGMRAGLRAWSSSGAWREDPEFAPKLRKEASRHRDPQLLALLALMSDDNDEKIHSAAEAVQADPSLTWIYSMIRLNEQPCCRPHPLVEPGVVALEKWDPDNAVPRLLAAEMIFERAEKAWVDSGKRDYFDLEKAVEQDPKWLRAMDFAFKAPKYDGYAAKTFDLYRAVAARYDVRKPELTLEAMLQSWLWEPRGQTRIYDGWLLEQGEAAERAGHLEAASAFYWKPAIFAEQVVNQDRNENANTALTYVERDSFEKLQPLLAKMGRPDEAAIVRYRMASLQATIEGTRWDGWFGSWRWYRDGWAGLAIRCLAIVIPLLTAAALVSLFVVFLRGHANADSLGRGFAASCACSAVDLCPVLLLISSAGLFAAYHPISVAYQRVISAPWQVNTMGDLEYAANAAYGLPMSLAEFYYAYFNAYHYWMAAIVALSMLALYILFRGTLKRTTI